MVHLLLSIAGVDHEKLKSSPKSERVVYPALGFLMCLAAIWTGFGISYKLSSTFNLPTWQSISIFSFTFLFALLLEMVVVGTLKSNSKILGNLGVRILLGINLMILQVVPILVIVFQPSIELYKNEQILIKTAEAKTLAEKTQNIDILSQMNSFAQERYTKAQANKLNPPENKKITKIEDSIKSKNSEVEELQKELKKQQVQFNKILSEIQSLRNNINTTSETNEKASFQKKITGLVNQSYAKEAQVKSIKSSIAGLAEEITALESEKEAAIVSYEEFLEKELADSQKDLEEKKTNINQAMNKVEQISSNANNLAQLANTSKFFNDISTLLEIMSKNISILFTSMFIIFIALLIDLMPILTKIQLSKGVYAKMVNDDEEILNALNELKKTKAIRELDKQQVELERQKIVLEQQRLKLQEYHNSIMAQKIKNEQIFNQLNLNNSTGKNGIISSLMRKFLKD